MDGIKAEVVNNREKLDFSDNPLARPNRFIINFLLFVLGLLGCVFLTSIRTYILFAIATALVCLVNYKPKEIGTIVDETGKTMIGSILLIFSISFMTGILNSSNMIGSLADLIINNVPQVMLRYFPALWAWLRPILDCFVPYQAWTSIPPLLVGIGAGIGMSAYQVLCVSTIACFGGDPCSPLIPTGTIGCGLAEIDMMDNMKFSLKYCAALNALVLIFAVVIGLA